MQKHSKFDDTNPIIDEKPDEGYYILEIVNATEGMSKNGNEPLLKFEFDILEGDYAGFFTSLSQKFNKNYLLQYYQLTNNEKSLPFFKRVVLNIEASNIGYKFDFTVHSLRGKKVGAYLKKYHYESAKGPREYLKVDKLYTVGKIRELLGKQITERLTAGTGNNNERYQSNEFKPNEDDLPW